MGFCGWPPESVEFFCGLQADNTKAYWSAHHALYEASVRTPMAELLSELSGEFGHGRIARPYRGMRFRAAKSRSAAAVSSAARALSASRNRNFLRPVATGDRAHTIAVVIASDTEHIARTGTGARDTQACASSVPVSSSPPAVSRPARRRCRMISAMMASAAAASR